MKAIDLLNIVKKQRDNLSKFHEVVLLKQRALIMNDHKAIEGAILREEKLISLVERNEKERVEVIKDLDEKYNLGLSTYRITEFLNKSANLFEEKLQNEFKRELELIERFVEEVQKVNGQNQFLINNARAFIRDLVTTVAGTSKKAIVDRKM